MSPKEQFLAALKCANTPGKIPWWELEFHLWHLYDDEPVYFGEAFARLSRKEKWSAVETNAEVMVRVAEKLGFSAITIPGDYWEIAPGKPAYYWLPERFRELQTKSLSRLAGDRIALVVNTGGVMAMPGASRYVDFSTSMFDRPEEIEREARWILEKSKVLIKKFFDQGVEVFLSASDLADNSGPFFPPEQFERFVLPFLGEWSAFIESREGYSILHTDGNIDMYMEQIADTPLHALQAIDPLSGMDILDTKKKVGDRLCLCGNLDCGMVLTSSPEVVRSASESLLQQLSMHSGYIFGMSNVLEADTPQEKIEAVRQGFREFAR